MKLITGRRIGSDTESTGLNPWAGDRPYAFSFANAKGSTAYAEFRVDPFTRGVDYRRPVHFLINVKRQPLRKAWPAIKAFYRDRRITKVFHNAKHDVRHLEAAGVRLRGSIEDTEFKLRVCDSTRLTYELKPATKDLFGMEEDDGKELVKAVAFLRQRAVKLGYAVGRNQFEDDEERGKKNAKGDYWLIQHAKAICVQSLRFLKSYKVGSPRVRARLKLEALKKAAGMGRLGIDYATQDAVRAVVLDAFLEPKLDEYKIRHIYNEEMREVWPVTYAIEGRGIFLRRKLVLKGRRLAIEQVNRSRRTIKRLCSEAKCSKHLNHETFPNSYPQKTRYFLGELGLAPLHYDKKTKNPKLDKTFLEHYADKTPMAGALQAEGKGAKAKGTYFDNYLSWMDAAGILHGSFQQIGARTGRYSARLMQNVPKRAKCPACRSDLKIAGWVGDRVKCKACKAVVDLDLMQWVRRPFGPRPGCVWYGMDFQQIEARVFADEAKEKFMLRSFRLGEDVYQKLADEIKEAIDVDVTRQDTKAIFLGKLYGLGWKKLIKQIMDAAAAEIDEDTARLVVDTFDEKFPRVSEFMQETIREAKENRCVYNRYGQRVDILPPRFDPDLGKVVDDSYKGVNYKIQSSAARLMKRAMVKCHNFLVQWNRARFNGNRRLIEKFGAHLVMTIHDELIFEFHKDHRPRSVIKKLAALMADNEGKFTRVKTPVDVSKITGSWLEPVACDWVTCV